MPTVLRTARLTLEPFTPADAAQVAAVINDREIARSTQNIPHPYDESMARAWIAGHAAGVERHSPVVFAVRLTETGELVGAVGLVLNADHRRAELGYWVARAAWGRGYATEAARALVHHGFEVLGLERIHAAHFAHNPASGRVMEKVGMRREGLQAGHVIKWGAREDLVLYGMLREDHRGTGAG